MQRDKDSERPDHVDRNRGNRILKPHLHAAAGEELGLKHPAPEPGHRPGGQQHQNREQNPEQAEAHVADLQRMVESRVHAIQEGLLGAPGQNQGDWKPTG